MCVTRVIRMHGIYVCVCVTRNVYIIAITAISVTLIVYRRVWQGVFVGLSCKPRIARAPMSVGHLTHTHTTQLDATGDGQRTNWFQYARECDCQIS